MPSPFPGMDPYLEDPVLWPGVHQDFITLTKLTLNARLPSHYALNTGERLYVVQSDRSIYPDVAMFEAREPVGRSSGATSATAAVSDAPWVLIVEPVEVREVFLEILALREGERVVTVIEVLSFTNKAPRSEGRRLYTKKQEELLASDIHMLEIDLLRGGEHLVAAPREQLLHKGRWDYLACLHRDHGGGRFEVWPSTIQKALPRVKVPLSAGDPDLVLDLQGVFTRCYDEAGYARRLDYRKDPSWPLSADDAAWADALLKQKGLR
ncbi:MAG: DUF4058 family protein [Planctomycetes bacterium]|nr:DUF4058 family protein [Planctomycetota bacterium]